ncbi:hypothetical protein ACOMHN_033085 [Nucella lapillus]
MEVLYRNQPVFGAQPATMVFPSASCPGSLYAAPSHQLPPYTCYPFHATSPAAISPQPPSRTPTPEYPSGSRSNAMSEGTTLKSVLRGEVPEAYSHFLSSSSSSSRSVDGSHRHQQQPSPLGKRKCPFVEVASCSPVSMARMSSTTTTTVLSPPPEDVQTEPMDLSLKRPSSASSDASSPGSFHHTFPPSPAEDHHQGHSSEFSLLRNLLQVGKNPQQSSSSFSSSSSSFSASSPFHSASPTMSSSSERSCDSPCSSDSGFPPTRHLCGSTRVTLAKKNMYPVSARVSDWLVKAVQFAHSLQYFEQELNTSDKFTLLLNSWSRLLLLFMAESNFQFVVTPLRTETESSGEGDGVQLPSPDEPTMKSVEAIQTFIRKCQHMGVEGEEYHYMRMLVLFNSGNAGVCEPSKVDRFNSQIQKSLQMHVQSTRPRDIMHYSRLLMCLPSLYGISANMVERLFCRHINQSGPNNISCLLRDLVNKMDR